MILEREVNVYNQDAIAASFQTQDTKISVVQGEINAIISETELAELISGGKTMYTAMNDIAIDVSGVHATMSAMQTQIDADGQSITAVDSRVTQLSATVDGLDATISRTQQDVSNLDTRATQIQANVDGVSSDVSALTRTLETDYLTAQQVQSTYATQSSLNQTAESITSSVSATYATKTQAQGYANTAKSDAISTAAGDATSKANAAKTAAIADTDSKLRNYSTTAQMNSAISQSAENITSSVSATYATKTYAETKANAAQTNAISAAASDATSKANAAKSEAIIAAASDATSKANAAKAEAIADTDEKLQSYSTTVQMNSAISQSAAQITSSVSATYVTSADARSTYETKTDSDGKLEEAKAYTDGEIVADNLITYPYDHTTATKNGLTFTVYSSGSVKVSGTATAQTTFYLQEAKTIPLQIGKYAISGAPSGYGTRAGLRVVPSIGTAATDYGSGAVLNITSSGVKAQVCILILNGTTVNDAMFYPQLEPGETAHAWRSPSSSQSSRMYSAESSITQTAEEISLKVSKDGVISAINQSPESVTIQANKINLTGYITATNLRTAGQTVINGANITTGIIKDPNNNTSFNLTTGALNMKSGSINLGNGTFSVTSGGSLTATSATIKGKVTCGYYGSAGPWMMLDTDGWIKGGLNSTEVKGYINCGAQVWDIDARMFRNGIITRGGILDLRHERIAVLRGTSLTDTSIMGYTGPIQFPIRMYSDGRVAEWVTRRFINGILT